MDGLYMNMMHVFTGMYYYRQKEKKVEVLLTTLPGMKSGDVLSVEQVLQVKASSILTTVNGSLHS